MKTLAAVMVGQKRNLELMQVTIPGLQYGQVLVELSASRICGSQLGEIDGVKGEDRWLPHLLGHEGCGRVMEVGPEVKKVKPGDRVCLHWRPGTGIESRPPVYGSVIGKVNAGFVTTFNHHAVISENRMTVVPEFLDDEAVCLLADTLTTGFGIIHHDAKVKMGESVVIIGAGGIGLGAILGAKLAGAYPVIAVDLHEHKLDKAKEFGAHFTINSMQNGFAKEVESILGGRADVVADGTGQPGVILEALKATGSQSRIILYGVMPFDKTVSLNTLQLHFGKVLTGSEGGGSRPAVEIPRYIRMIENGVFDPSGMVSHRGQLEDVNTLIGKMRQGDVIHAILRYGND